MVNDPPRAGARAAPLWRRWRRWARTYFVIGVALLANGAALLIHILRGVPLPPFLLVLWAAGLAAIAVAFIRAHTIVRQELARTFVVGVAIGLIATVVYDATKAVLSLLDPAPWNPFEATRVFGVILLGPDAPDAAHGLAGWGFHLSNGATFGMSFSFIFGRRARASRLWAVALGAAWGLFLESFQLALYPGWLGITGPALAEFQQVSFLAHAAFGVTLGILARRWLPPEGWIPDVGA